MHTEKRAPSEDPKQQPLGAVVWGFIVASVAIAGVIFYNIPSAIHSIRLATDGEAHSTFKLFFQYLIHILMVWLILTVYLLIKRHSRARICAQGVLFFAMGFTPFMTCISIFIYPETGIYLLIFLINLVTLVFLYCFLKKWYLFGGLLVVAGIIVLFTITITPMGALFIVYQSSAHIALLLFPLLYYFTHAPHMKKLFPRQFCEE